MSETLSFALLCFTSLFTLINPLGTMPVFMSMTSKLSEDERKRTARKASIVALLTIIAFAFTGQLLFRFFGISVNGFRIVGGVIFFLMGMDMLHAKISQIHIKESEVKSYESDISITPLAIPLICGPGAITNVIVSMQDADTYEKKIILLSIIIITMIITYLILYSASKLIKLFGETGINVMMRIMGLIIMVIGVELFFSGLRPIIFEIMKMK